MFGYLKPAAYGKLKHVNQHYRRNYCTLCHALWKYYGFSSRFLLSYDMTFLSCLLDLDSHSTNMNSKLLCYKKQPIESEEWKRLSALLLFMVEGKIVDNICDNNSSLAKIASIIYRKPFKKAEADYHQTHNIVMKGFEEFRELEKQGAALEDLANAFAEIMKQSTKSLFKCSEISEETIRHVARWIYFIDAVDDLDDDIKKGCFNPFSKIASSKLELTERHSEELIRFSENTTKKLKEIIGELDFNKLSSNVVISILNIAIPNTTIKVFTNEKLSSKKRIVRMIEGKNVVYE